MVRHIVKVLDDGALAAGDGWVVVRCWESGCLFFLVEQSAASREEVLQAAWDAASQEEMREAVQEGIRIAHAS